MGEKKNSRSFYQWSIIFGLVRDVLTLLCGSPGDVATAEVARTMGMQLKLWGL